MKKILIIEDERILMETASDFLRDEGYEVLKATDGETGIEMATLYLPDLILCDISMPKFDGYQVYEKLQSGFSTARIPFIFMTARAERDEVRIGMQMGADDYITKPINFRELKKSISIRLDKVEKTIRKSEAKYHALFQLAKDAILVLNPGDGKILDANQSCINLLGYQKDELLRSAGYPMLLGATFTEENLFWNSDNMADTEWRKKSGEMVPMQVSGTSIEVGGETIFLLIARDTTEIQAKEVALKASEEKYRDLVENTGEGLGSVNSDERFIYVNPAACEIFGLPAEKMIGAYLPDFLEPSSVEEVTRQTAARKEGQKSMYELKIIRPDKGQRWIIVTATPQYDADGSFSGTFGIFRDITKRKLAEEKLLESEQRLREIVDLTNDWIWEIDPEWKYRYVSPKIFNILGYTREEMIGKSPFDFLLPEDVANTKLNLRTFVHQYKPLNAIETRATHKSGKVVYLETSGAPVFDDKGNYMGYRGADRDITLRKLYEKELIISKDKAQESDRLKSSILANISHELRTPLNGILGFAEILKQELRDTEYDIMAENIHSSGRRLMSTLNSIITLSQLEAGKVALSVKPIMIEESIASVIKSMESYAAEKRIFINTMGVKPMEISSDDHLFRQLFRQIVDNAIKFTENGGISIETHKVTEENTEWAVVKVSDTGIGISKEYYEIIFHEFRQVSEGFGRQYQGSGIGLTISKKIIDLLNGKITLESEQGKGSAFYIWLPAGAGDKHTEETAGNGESSQPVRKRNGGQAAPGAALLLVEDNQVNTDLTRFFLRKQYQVDSALDALAAVEMVKNRQYAAILMDINLGHGMNGLEAAKEIRKVKGYENTPIIAVTGYTLQEEREKFVAEGCTHYIAKPYDQASLLAILEEAIPE
jgi:PAS domain S-box-containing protein